VTAMALSPVLADHEDSTLRAFGGGNQRMIVFMTKMWNINDGSRIIGSDPEMIARGEGPENLDDPQNRQGTEQTAGIEFPVNSVGHGNHSKRLDVASMTKPGSEGKI